MTTVPYTVLQVCPVFEDGPTVWIACGYFERGGEQWTTLGAATDAFSAYLDLSAVLEEEGVTDATLVKCEDGEERRALAKSARMQTVMRTGVPVREVPEADEIQR